jgi:hypothetical protein
VNVYESKSIVYGRAFLIEMLGAIPARPATALVAAGKLRLSQDPSFNPTTDSSLASLVSGEANYTGYTPGGYAVTFGGPVSVDSQTDGLLVAQTFLAGGPFVSPSNAVTGWWIDDGTIMVAGERFANGQTAAFGSATDWLDLTVLLPLPPSVVASA